MANVKKMWGAFRSASVFILEVSAMLDAVSIIADIFKFPFSNKKKKEYGKVDVRSQNRTDLQKIINAVYGSESTKRTRFVGYDKYYKATVGKFVQEYSSSRGVLNPFLFRFIELMPFSFDPKKAEKIEFFEQKKMASVTSSEADRYREKIRNLRKNSSKDQHFAIEKRILKKDNEFFRCGILRLNINKSFVRVQDNLLVFEGEHGIETIEVPSVNVVNGRTLEKENLVRMIYNASRVLAFDYGQDVSVDIVLYKQKMKQAIN